MMPVCRYVARLSYHLYQWELQQPNVGEESLTDFLLWQISQLPFVKYRKFSKREEGQQTGADWEWWFVDRYHALGLRVQAKRLRQNGKENFRLLAHKTRHGYQIEMLINSSKKKNLLPFYVFYWPGTMKVRCRLNRGREEGAFLTTAFDICYSPVRMCDFLRGNARQKEQASLNSGDLLSISNPLSCLFCCPAVEARLYTPTTALFEFIRMYWPIIDDYRENPDQPLGLHERPPRYIQVLLDSERIPDWFDSEYQRIIDAKAVLVYDMREW